MPTSTSAVNDAIQIALGLLGLVVLAYYVIHPKAKAWRAASVTAPSWNTSLSDSLLLILIVGACVFIGPLIGASIARFVPGGKETGGAVQVLAGNIGMFTLAPIALAAVVTYLRGHGNSVATLNAPTAPAPLDAVGIGFLTFLGAMPLMLAVLIPWTLLLKHFGYAMEKQPVVDLLLGDSPPSVRLGLVIVAVVLAPVTEEIIFRAGLYRMLRGVVPRWAALLISATVFATLHFNVAAFIALVALGAIWAHVYEKSGSIVVTIVAHALFNLTSIALMLNGQLATG